jgi:hypothetical protein
LEQRVEPGRVLSTYPDVPEVAPRLARLVAAERDCCPLLDVDVSTDGGVSSVDLRYPAHAATLLVAVLAGEAPATRA